MVKQKAVWFLAIILSPDQVYVCILVDCVVYNYCLAENPLNLFYFVLYFIVIYCMPQGGNTS